MDKQQLEQYIEDKGNARKEAMYNITVIQTRDYRSTHDSHNQMKAQVDRLEQEEREYR